MAAPTNQVVTLNTNSTNITTGSYVTFTAATTPNNTNQMLITNTTTALLKMAVGAAGSEVDMFQIPPSGTILLQIPLNSIPLGSRLSLKSIDTETVSSGYVAATVFI